MERERGEAAGAVSRRLMRQYRASLLPKPEDLI